MSVVTTLRLMLLAAEFQEQASSMLTSARNVSEGDLQTLERVLRERMELIRLLEHLGVKPTTAAGDWSSDWFFTRWPGPVGALRAHLGLPRDEPNGWRETEKARKREAEWETEEHAVKMAELWMNRAVELREKARQK